MDVQKNENASGAMLVTVLSVAFNSGATIARTIESVLNQTYPNIEYIIVDGASKDNTVEVAESYREQFEAREGRTLRIISEPDKGMYDALNKGARAANGVLVGSVNTDDYYEPTAVEDMVDFYRETGYDVAWADIMIHKPTGSIRKKAKIGKLWTSIGFCHPSMFATKETLVEYPYACINMYDDFEFATRVHMAGKKVLTTNKLVSNFNFGGMSTTKNFKNMLKRIKIKYSIYKRHKMSPLYWFYCAAMEFAKFILA